MQILLIRTADPCTSLSLKSITNGLGLLDGLVFILFHIFTSSFLLLLFLFPSKSPLSPPIPHLNKVSRNYKVRKISLWESLVDTATTPAPITSTYHVGQTVAGSQETPGCLMLCSMLDVL